MVRKRLEYPLALALCALLFSGRGDAVHGQCTSLAEITASDEAAGNGFGFLVSVSGDRMAVGTPSRDCDAENDCGSVYVYRFDGSIWIEEQVLTSSDIAPGDGFGQPVSLNGDVLVAGAPGDDCGPIDWCGGAYVFRFDGSVWQEEQKLVPPTQDDEALFAWDVRLGTNSIVLGIGRSSCAAGGECGSVLVYAFDGSSWVEQQRLIASDAGAGDLFGDAVFIDGDLAVVGAWNKECPGDPDEHAVGEGCGAAYVFRFDGSSWGEEQKLTASDGAAGDDLGTLIAADGDWIFVSAFDDDCPEAENCGAVYAFHYDGSTWVEAQKIAPPNPTANEYYGYIAVDGSTLLIGAPGEDCLEGADCGAAYVFNLLGSSWIQQRRLVPNGAAESDSFGSFWGDAVQGALAVVGSPGKDCTAGADCGAAYTFDVTCPNVPAVSVWGMMAMVLLTLTGGTLAIKRTRALRT